VLSWENKELYGEINWAQFDYFTAIKNYKGELSRGTHGSFEEVQNYLDINGDDSLPKSFFEMFHHGYSRSFTEF